MVYHNRAKEREKQASPLEGLGEAQIEAWIERLRGESWLLSVSLPDAKERMPGAEPLGCSPSKIWDIALFSVAKKPGNNQKSPLGDKRINKMQYIHVVVQSLSHVWLFATSWTVVHQTFQWNSSCKNTGAGCHSLLQGILWPRDWTQVSRTAGRYFTTWATREEFTITLTLFLNLLYKYLLNAYYVYTRYWSR